MLEVCPEVSALQMLHKSIHRIRYDEVMSRTVWFCFLSISESIACDSKGCKELSQILPAHSYRLLDHGFIGFIRRNPWFSFT